MEALRRYTNLSATLHLLGQKKLTLLPPDTWDDTNDRRLVEAYRKKNGFETVLCLCFAKAAETYHHWKVFSPGTDGMCLVFDRDILMAAIAESGAQYREVKYYTIEELSTNEPELKDLPFSKRAAYKPEGELRVLWSSNAEKIRHKDIELPIAALDRVIINPWLPKALAESVKQVIRSIPDWHNLEVLQSTVTDGPAWRQLADRYA